MTLIFKKILIICLYLMAAYFVNLLIKKVSRFLIFGIEKTANTKLIQKTQTLKSFFDGFVAVTVFSVFLFLILDYLGVNLLPFVTGAGIFGLALSFGSQTLVKDLISGFFIILENQFNVGDYIKIGMLEGRVKKITLRQTILKDKEDNLIIIPNSKIEVVIKIKK